ncbi:hypothetical protein EV137_7342 [Kribbella pratensis]|uniref:Uncharacterized protein n=1 Tax=Kribbella pratensis TaxID=2512112 RepID=A0ABY2F826_9ACTN|nr:hypothetical protein EV137_7342 [Kribbella pratensis]
MTRYRLLVREEVLRQLATLRQAGRQQPGGLRDREFRTIELGLRAIAHGQEADFSGKRLGFATHDLSDCAEIKLSAIPESRGSRELGPSHRLIYREFEAEDGGPPYRQVIAFEPRRDDRPFDVAAARLGRERGVRIHEFRPVVRTDPPAPIRPALPQDLRTALAAASGVAPASGAVRAERPAQSSHVGAHCNSPPSREV